MKTLLAIVVASLLVTACGHTRYVGTQEYFDHVKENGR